MDYSETQKVIDELNSLSLEIRAWEQRKRSAHRRIIEAQSEMEIAENSLRLLTEEKARLIKLQESFLRKPTSED